MGQFTPGYQPGFNNYAQNDGFSGGGESPLGSGDPQPSTSGFNGASLVQTNGNPQGGVYSQPGRFGNPVAPLIGGVPGVGGANPNSQFNNANFKPTYSAPGGYNPLQYADDNTANTLAQGLGGTVERTKTLGPFGDFGQNQISFGNGNQLNAGLLADRYSKYDAATANAMTDVEKNAGPAVKDPNAGAVYLTGNPMMNPSQTPGYHPPVAPTARGRKEKTDGRGLGVALPDWPPPTPTTTNPLVGGPGTEPVLTGPQPGAMTQQPGGQQNQLMQLLQLLGMGGQQQQYRQPYANSGYYPNLPRTNQGVLNWAQSQGASGNPLTGGGANPTGANAFQRPQQQTPEQTAAFQAMIKYRDDFYNKSGLQGWNNDYGLAPAGVMERMPQANAALEQDPEYQKLRQAFSTQLGSSPTPAANNAPTSTGTQQNSLGSMARTGSLSPQMQQILANGPASPTASYNMNTGQWTDDGFGLGVNYAQGSGNQNSLSQQNVQRQLLSLLLGF